VVSAGAPILATVEVAGYERVVHARDEAAGYEGWIVVHDTTLGPAIGGTRLWHYPGGRDEALRDALRLARGMTYKNACAGLAAGGGKSVLLLPAGGAVADRARLFRAHARAVESLGGVYVTAEDVGTTPADMEEVARLTRHVVGLPGTTGDPSPRTARGVFRALQAALRHRRGSDAMAGLTVALQGCGNVGRHLALQLRAAGASLVVADVDADRAARLAEEVGGRVAAPERIHQVRADVFSPNALGAVLNDDTIPLLRAGIVVGGANNQLAEPRHDDLLRARGILYGPDYVANAGGVITGFGERSGGSVAESDLRVEGIRDTMAEVLRIADREGIGTSAAADRLAERRLAEGRTSAGRG
jgi:leucine dehydrogenase